MDKKPYIKPQINRVALDYTFSLQMKSHPKDPPPRPPRPGSGGGSDSGPFASPFDDNTFK